MPSRRRSDIGARTAAAKRLRLVRQSETTEQRQRRLGRQRSRQLEARASETVERREARLMCQRIHQHMARAKETEDQRRRRLEADRLRHARLRNLETDAQRERRLSADRERHARRSKSIRMLEDEKGTRPETSAGRKKKRNRRARYDFAAAARRREREAVVKENNRIKRVLKRWINNVKKEIHVACLGSCEDENVRVKMEPIEYVEVHSVSDGDERADPASSVEIPSSSCGPASSLPQDRPSPESHCPAIIESEADPLHLDPSLKPVEVFLKIPEDQHTASRTASSNSVEMDPLCVDGRSEPLALITMSDEGVLREENYATTSGGPAKVVIAMMIKEEEVEDGELES